MQLTIPLFGNHGLFLGLAVFMLIRAVTLLFYFPAIEAAIHASDESD
jgi:Na+-driven multidrug efflux pump